MTVLNQATDVINWFNQAAPQQRLSLEDNCSNLQVKKNRANELVIVLVEISPSLRGSGLFRYFILQLIMNGIDIVVELPQPKLASFCKRSNIAVILDEEEFNYFS